MYNERYRVLQKLGWGHFSTVWRCADMADGGRIVALKVQKSASHYTEAAADEIAILDFVGDQADGMGQDIPVVRLLDTFTHNGPHGRRESCLRSRPRGVIAASGRARPACGQPRPFACVARFQATAATDLTSCRCLVLPPPLPPSPPPQTRAWYSSCLGTTCSA